VAGEIQRLVCDVPCQIFTEHDFSDPALADKKWGRIKFPRILAIAREMGLSGTLFNTSGGYFAVSRQAVSNFVGLAFKFMRRFGDEGGYVTEEPGLSFAALSLCEQPSLYDYTHVHAIDCVRHHESYPRDERWTNRKWATGESYEVSPGILHAARGKRVLTEFGRRLGKDMCGLANSAESLSD
jgi:hypothetical protein